MLGFIGRVSDLANTGGGGLVGALYFYCCVLSTCVMLPKTFDLLGEIPRCVTVTRWYGNIYKCREPVEGAVDITPSFETSISY